MDFGRAASVADGPGNRRKVYESLACVNCHTVRGTSSRGVFGPDLTHLVSRSTIAAGMLPNTEQNLKRWIQDPQQMKPGCLMPAMQLTGPQVNQVVAYLRTLAWRFTMSPPFRGLPPAFL